MIKNKSGEYKKSHITVALMAASLIGLCSNQFLKDLQLIYRFADIFKKQ